MFRFNENIKSYKIPIIKMIVCSLLIVLLCSRGYFVHINNDFWNTVVNIVCILIGFLSMWVSFVSFFDMIELSDRREALKKDIETALKRSKKFSLEYILALLEENDIIEIVYLSDNQINKIGASSDSRRGSSKFFDKKFYINDLDSVSSEELKDKLDEDSIDGEIIVAAIDGVPANKYQER